MLVVYFDSRKMSALDLWRPAFRDTAGALLLREPELPADSELTSAEERPPSPSTLSPCPNGGNCWSGASQELTDRDSLSSAPTQLAVRNLARPLLLESPDSCVDEPESTRRRSSRASFGDLRGDDRELRRAQDLHGDRRGHRRDRAGSRHRRPGPLNSTTLSATALSAPLALMIGCLIGSLHLRYRLKYEFHRQVVRLSRRPCSPRAGICVTISDGPARLRGAWCHGSTRDHSFDA